ncbi:hypothetical protein KRP22_001733 [Phytophthora ramorum]|nr:hypothetical protein KRP22_1014 [Phytophthora ramorum]
MHRYLSASNAQLGVLEQPFDRNIPFDDRGLLLIRDTLDELKQNGGIQMVAPEHRMSLELKRFELADDNLVVDQILDNDQFVDVLDESDALLHHTYHLVYAVGTLVPPSYTEKLQHKLKEALVLDLIDNASFELLWLTTLGGTPRESIVKAITGSSVSLQEALGSHMQKLLHFQCQLLALRGLLAFGVLEHCLEKRYRVDCGLPLCSSRQKKVAIPYRAADVPCERSEFSHPDVCVVLTLLGYYHRGLNDDEVKEAFGKLLRLNTSEQQQQYEQWYPSVAARLGCEDPKVLCDERHISLADKWQLEILRRVYKFSMEAINLFLNTCVFSKDTQQYPQRLSRTAWNLAAGSNNIGFSGARLLDDSREGKMPLENASMLEKETFMIFDEARSRGSDMKLLPDAAAVLTLGPKLTKDKLMQGAGRMRQLGCDQTLWIVSFDEVALSVLQTSGKTDVGDLVAVDVLNWVMECTTDESVEDCWNGQAMASISERLNTTEEQSVSATYGLNNEVCVTSHTNECERELQTEEENVKIRACEVAQCSPAQEEAWKYSATLSVRSVHELDGVVQIVDMESFVRQQISPELAHLTWTSARIFGTVNFFSTILARESMDRTTEFLRQIDVLLVFDNDEILLVSECEADHILKLV